MCKFDNLKINKLQIDLFIFISFNRKKYTKHEQKQ